MGGGAISKLSKGLMLPIALLPIAGLFLGVGSGISNIMNTVGVDASSPWYIIPDLMTEIGNIVFSNLAVLFAIALAIAFTEDAGVAAFSAFIGWIVFCVVQDVFIWDQSGMLISSSNFDVINQTDWSQYISEYMPAQGLNFSTVTDINSIDDLKLLDLDGNGYIDINEVNSWVVVTNTTTGETISLTQTDLDSFFQFVGDLTGNTISYGNYYNILFYDTVPTSVVTTSCGIQSMQTSVFGGIVVGLFVAWIYNKFYKLQLPKSIGFFSGTKSVPIITFLFIPIISFFFLFTWPPLGKGLESLGKALGDMPYGTDAFVFGVVERALVPFGLHHAFYTPLWFTSAGGSFFVLDQQGNVVTSAFGSESIWFAINNYTLDFNSLLSDNYWYDFSSQFAANSGLTQGSWSNWYDQGWVIYDPSALGTGSMDSGFGPSDQGYYFVMTSGTNPGEYMQGKYSFMIFGLPAAGFAMIMAAKKENREVAFSIIGAAMLTTFLTGVTEPLEFTFLFIAPMLYVFHVFLCGFSFWFADAMQASVGMTFSGGIIDLSLYGILPWATGISGVGWWWLVAFGVVLMPIYYFLFYWYIKRFDVKTPGRTSEGEDIHLVSKAEYKAAKSGVGSSDGGAVATEFALNTKEGFKTPEEINAQLDLSIKFNALPEGRREKVRKIIIYLGGFENLKSITSCITKLRLVVVDLDIIDEEKIKNELKPSGIIKRGFNVHIVFGGEADIYRSELNDIKKELYK
ncbi:MAG: PTS sugar transporter [Candidatus Hepatoplasma vulgare]|nr:MAG: PTS sugar transporter [Candidatus Hepatoplasma sp.]